MGQKRTVLITNVLTGDAIASQEGTSTSIALIHYYVRDKKRSVDRKRQERVKSCDSCDSWQL